MYNFIVLGMIPGTDIQITFQMWSMVTMMLGGLIALRYLLAVRAQALEPVRVSKSAKKSAKR